jgi:muramoyltetrapeptide carboxypeptidase
VPALYAAHGWRARIYPGCAQRCDYLAGDDNTRLADLHAALADPEVAAIHCMRGGYGSMRILDRIDAGLVRRAAKLLIGYSDITALHALWAQQGLASLHAPMPASDLLQARPRGRPRRALRPAARWACWRGSAGARARPTAAACAAPAWPKAR